MTSFTLAGALLLMGTLIWTWPSWLGLNPGFTSHPWDENQPTGWTEAKRQEVVDFVLTFLAKKNTDQQRKFMAVTGNDKYKSARKEWKALVAAREKDWGLIKMARQKLLEHDCTPLRAMKGAESTDVSDSTQSTWQIANTGLEIPIMDDLQNMDDVRKELLNDLFAGDHLKPGDIILQPGIKSFINTLLYIAYNYDRRAIKRQRKNLEKIIVDLDEQWDCMMSHVPQS